MSKFKYFPDGSWEFEDNKTNNESEITMEKPISDCDIFVSGVCENPNIDALTEAEYTINISMSEILRKIKSYGNLKIDGCLTGDLGNGIKYYYPVTNADERSFIISKELVVQDPQAVQNILGRDLITNYDIVYTYVGTRLSEYGNTKNNKGVFEPCCVGMYIFEDDDPNSSTYGKVLYKISEFLI